MSSGFESTFERILRGKKKPKSSEYALAYRRKYNAKKRAIAKKLKELQAIRG